jgi:thiosulfate/3-mercaptopyruvate sulfurtransferase
MKPVFVSKLLPLISTDWLASHLDDPHLCVLDATVFLAVPEFDGDYRATSGYAQWLTGHIPGSRHADLLGALSDSSSAFGFTLPPVPVLTEALKDLGISDTSKVAVYDADGGIWAARLWWMLRSLGIAARVLDGGWGCWRAEHRPVERGERAFASAQSLSVKPHPEMWASKAQVRAVLNGQREATLVCALSVATFTGHAPSRYSRRGHIPNSINLPARSLTDANGRYLSPRVSLSWVNALGLPGNEALVLYCGGGIAACSLALVLSALGYTDLSVYDGSLQEWSADPTQLMLTGNQS